MGYTRNTFGFFQRSYSVYSSMTVLGRALFRSPEDHKKHKLPTTHDFWYPPYVGHWNQNVRSSCLYHTILCHIMIYHCKLLQHTILYYNDPYVDVVSWAPTVLGSWDEPPRLGGAALGRRGRGGRQGAASIGQRPAGAWPSQGLPKGPSRRNIGLKSYGASKKPLLQEESSNHMGLCVLI